MVFLGKRKSRLTGSLALCTHVPWASLQSLACHLTPDRLFSFFLREFLNSGHVKVLNPLPHLAHEQTVYLFDLSKSRRLGLKSRIILQVSQLVKRISDLLRGQLKNIERIIFEVSLTKSAEELLLSAITNRLLRLSFPKSIK